MKMPMRSFELDADIYNKLYHGSTIFVSVVVLKVLRSYLLITCGHIAHRFGT